MSFKREITKKLKSLNESWGNEKLNGNGLGFWSFVEKPFNQLDHLEKNLKSFPEEAIERAEAVGVGVCGYSGIS